MFELPGCDHRYSCAIAITPFCVCFDFDCAVTGTVTTMSVTDTSVFAYVFRGASTDPRMLKLLAEALGIDSPDEEHKESLREALELAEKR